MDAGVYDTMYMQCLSSESSVFYCEWEQCISSVISGSSVCSDSSESSESGGSSESSLCGSAISISDGIFTFVFEALSMSPPSPMEPPAPV